MADEKISGLNPATLPLAGTELVPIVQGGETKKVSVSEISGNNVTEAPIDGLTYGRKDAEWVEVSDGFIPLSGTEVDKPITGDLAFKDDDFAYQIYKANTALGNLSAFIFGEVNCGFAFLHSTFTKNLTLTPEGLEYTDTNPDSFGFRGHVDFSANITDLDYVQKIYVDTKLKQTEATTGAVISFANPQVYNTYTTPTSSNITNDLTGAKIGIVQKIYSNKATEPTYPAGWVKLSGTYTNSVTNIIYAEWCEGSRVEYWIVEA